MPVLIDGNNLVFAARDVESAEWQPGRTWLIARLVEWGRRRRDDVCIVFDGRPPREPAPFAPSLSVIYSGAGVSADSVLIGLVQRDSAPRRLIVVSTDREIAAAARRRRARAVRSDAFWRHVLHDLTRPVRRSVEPREKRTGLPPDQVDAWLRELGFEPQ